jgi:hypothetical protein
MSEDLSKILQKFDVLSESKEKNDIGINMNDSLEEEITSEWNSFISEEDPCWDGYEQVGMKKKGSKQVPNCVPKSKKKRKLKEVESNVPQAQTAYQPNQQTIKQTAQQLNKLKGSGANINVQQTAQALDKLAQGQKISPAEKQNVDVLSKDIQDAFTDPIATAAIMKAMKR